MVISSHQRSIWPEVLGVGPGVQYFFKCSQLIVMQNKDGEFENNRANQLYNMIKVEYWSSNDTCQV